LASLANWQQEDWSRLDGSIQGNIWWASDGIVPVYSQAPNFAPAFRRRVTLRTNHLEEINHQNPRRELDRIFRSDLAIPLR
jgi:hypothetical protein